MEQHRDEQIECADCGASFVFSAAEAAVFAERGLSAPKRCKDCRRARKSRAAEGGGGPRPHGGRAPGNGDSWNGNGARASGPRFNGNGPPRRYTGDVNEYRSPMADNYASTYAAPRPFAPRGPQGRGEYRSPMPDAFNNGAPRFADRRPAPGRPRGPRFDDTRGPRFDDTRDGNRRPPNGEGFHAHAEGGPARGAGPKRSRPPAEMFAITCSSCGQSAEVPFKPAEGRDVFCPTCYRARRPQA